MPNESPTPRPLSGIPILIVEADPISARLLTAVLRSAGADTRVTASAEAALLALETSAVRVVVVELVLPGMGGLLLAKQITGHPRWRHIAVIAVSSVNGPGTEHMALEHGCAAYAQKPFDIDAFVTTISTHLKEEK